MSAFQILCLSGGGFRGLYTAAVLEELETKAGRPLAECFDLIAGTSIGGIIALGLAARRSAQSIKQAFDENGQKIFSADRRALAEATQREAAAAWSELFKHFFPLPDEQTVLAEASAVEVARRAIIVPEILVNVTLPGGRTYSVKNAALNVPKDSKLNFELENYVDLPANSFVTWTVRNQGKHAESLNDLGHFSAYGQTAGPETAEYAGRHYMDVTIEHGGRTIGMRRVPVTVVNTSLVARSRRLFKNKRR